MREDRKQARMREIEEAAYGLLAVHGYEGTSMLAVAKAAKASNETMYRWFGDKHGLFLAMVQGNAGVVSAALNDVVSRDASPLDALRQVAPVLLGMLVGERAVALNRAAAADVSGALGAALALGGRQAVLPVLQDLMRRAVQAREIAVPAQGELGPLFVHLLVGDMQIRRVIGVMAAPSRREVEEQARVAMGQFIALCGGDVRVE